MRFSWFYLILQHNTSVRQMDRHAGHRWPVCALHSYADAAMHKINQNFKINIYTWVPLPLLLPKNWPTVPELLQLLNCLRSAAERFPFLVLKHGTNYRKKSPLRHLCLPSNVISRHSYLDNHSRTLLLIDTLVDLVVILNYLGHSKEFCLTD